MVNFLRWFVDLQNSWSSLEGICHPKQIDPYTIDFHKSEARGYLSRVG